METNQIKPKYKSGLSFDFNSSRIFAIFATKDLVKA